MIIIFSRYLLNMFSFAVIIKATHWGYGKVKNLVCKLKLKILAKLSVYRN